MSDTKTRYIATMGEELGGCFYEIWNDVVWLDVKVSEFGILYGSNQNIEMLDEAAFHFFSFLQDVLIEDIILHISRLTDPKESGRLPNLVLESLLYLIRDRDFYAEMASLYQNVVDSSKACRKYRNKRIAHNDYESKLKSEGPSISKREIIEATESIKSFIARLSQLLKHCDLLFLNPLTSGAEELVRKLEIANSAANDNTD
jgi:hypothetical protein